MFKEVEVLNFNRVMKGGATTIENGQVLCSKCNASKGAR